ncbi:MAG TPA: translocation/assembly module TamB domain-containing protein [Acidobacteriaceae bacterium]|jgi:translocation and assembly module TamB|nr:translocation/assembly module TamB domain-containing protein [Acidobacteriaceae bacterium]
MSEPSAAASSSPKSGKSARGSGVLRVLGWIAASILVLLVVLIAGLSWYTTTADFQHRLGGEVVHVLETATGGRVELGHISFSLWHLAVEADDLVIHGTEGPGQMPYLSIAKVVVHVRINTFISHTVGNGPRSHIGVDYLGVDQPHLHLIIDKNGDTNQPVPKHPNTSNEPVQDTLLDLQAKLVQLNDGLVVVNDRAIPFDADANDLDAEVNYIRASDRYAMTVDLADLRTKMAHEPEVQSKLRMTAQLGRNMAQLTSFDFKTGGDSHLSATALVEQFAHPQWQVSVKGSLSVRQLGLLAGINGLEDGTLNLDVQGRNCTVTPKVAQQHPHFWKRLERRRAAPGEKLLPPSPECVAGYLMVGNIKLYRAAYRNADIRVAGVDATAQLHVTPTELLFTALTGVLPGGGRVDGELKIENWLGEVPPSAPAKSATTVAAAKTANTAAKSVNAKPPIQSVRITPVGRAHAYMTVMVKGITLRTIMDITAPEHYGDLGLDTAINGPVQVEWGGPAADISSSVQVDANLHLAPTGARLRGAKSNVPVSGTVTAHYDGRSQVVNIQKVDVQTPGTVLAVSGVLGVNRGDPLTNLQVNLQARDLGEFDQTLQTLGFQANGKRGSAAIPVDLHGTLSFVGTAKGAVRELDVKGHLEADNLAVHLGSEADIHVDSVVADAEYAPNSGLAIASSTIRRNTAVLNLAGTFRPHRVVSRRGVVSYVWDDDLGLNVTAKLANAQVADLLQVAGQQDRVKLTGTADITAHATGTLRSLSGSGNLTLTNGEVYGEPYQTIAVDVIAQGTHINATRLLVQAHDMAIHGSGSYDVADKHITAHITGHDLRLSKFQLVRNENLDVDALVSLNVNADGSVREPNLQARLQLADIAMDGKSLGTLNLTANSVGSTMSYQIHSNLIGAQIAAQGKTSLLGEFETEAQLTFSGLDVANALTLFAPGSVQANSQIAGTIAVNGPLAKPQLLSATAELTTFTVGIKTVKLESVGPIRATLRNGVAMLDEFHITGPGTDLQSSGSVRLFGDTNPSGGEINVKANGDVNLSLIHTFDPNLITSGRITLDAGVRGRVKQPVLTGTVKFGNANLAMDGIPNGLSNLNGTMAFNQNRLEARDVTAVSGGGKITLGGFIAYDKGLFADLTANADTVRVRLYGLSTTANANLRLQGGPQGMLLSGNILVTRFGIGRDVDFAAFSSVGGVPTPPEPGSLTNKIRLDVHVTSAPQLDFQNSYAKLAGTVDLTLRGTIAQPSVLGTIRITDGSATFAGTKYELDRGTIYFTNPVRIDPTIDLDVSTRVENYDITVGIHGDMNNLKPTYRSSPPLTEADIFNLLALGRTQEEAQINTQQEQQAGEDPTSSALLGGALNATVSNRVSKLFGAGSIKIDPAFVGTLGNSTARITVQEPLSKQVTLVFATNVNQSAEQLIQVQYQINDSTSIVATRDESGVFSIVYKIRKRYR